MASVSSTQLGMAATGTQVSGTIYDNTTWTIANSPYIVSSEVIILANATLTIEPGVSVVSNFLVGGKAMFQVRGNLIAKGTPDNRITFNGGGNAIIFNPYYSTADSFLDLDYCVFSNASNFYAPIDYQLPYQVPQPGHFNLTHSEITNVLFSSYIYMPSKNDFVKYNIFNNSGGFIIDNGNGGCVFIEYNLFNGKGQICGAGESLNKTFVRQNTFANMHGIILTLGSGIPRPGMDATYAGLNATLNYWGTTDTSTIEAMIYDKKDDVTLYSYIPYLPILVAPDPNTPVCVTTSVVSGGSINPNGVVPLNYGGSQTFNIVPNTGYHISDVIVNGTSVGAVSSYSMQNIYGVSTISATFTPDPTPTPSSSPTPTPTSVPTATPTTNPTQTPTSNPTTNPTEQPTNTPKPKVTNNPTPTPTAPEFPAIVLLPLLLGIFSIALILRKGTMRKAVI